MKITDVTPESVSAMIELTEARRDLWEDMDVSPTMAANAAPQGSR